MSKVNIRGTIVPSYFDMDGMQEFIEKGLITPESYFEKMVNEAPKDEPLEVFINSPGGSVFAGYEMKNIVTRWQLETSQPVTVTIGAMAASAASTFALALGAPISAHENTKFMFHGAGIITWGGKDAHEDQADLLGKINAETMQRLTGKYNINPETVQEWFGEGRMGWLTAQEAKEAGIVDQIIEESAEAMRFSNIELSQLMQNGLAIAALFDGIETETEAGDTEAAEEETETEAPETTEEIEEEETPEIDDNALDQLLAEARQEEAAKCAGKIAELERKIESMNQALNKKQSTMDSINEQLKQAKSRLDRVSPKRSAAQSESADGEIAWKDALQICENDYVQARKRYPKSFENYMKECQ